MSELLSFMFSIAFFRLLTPPPLNITQATARKSKFYGGATQQPRFFQSSSSEATEVFGLIAKWFQHNQFFPLQHSTFLLQLCTSRQNLRRLILIWHDIWLLQKEKKMPRQHCYLQNASSQSDRTRKMVILFTF